VFHCCRVKFWNGEYQCSSRIDGGGERHTDFHVHAGCGEFNPLYPRNRNCVGGCHERFLFDVCHRGDGGAGYAWQFHRDHQFDEWLCWHGVTHLLGDFEPLRRLRYTYLHGDSDSHAECDDHKWNGERYSELNCSHKWLDLAQGAAGMRVDSERRRTVGFDPSPLDIEAAAELGRADTSADWLDTNWRFYGVWRRGRRRNNPGYAIESRYNCGQLHNHRDRHRQRLYEGNGEDHFHAHGELAAAITG